MSYLDNFEDLSSGDSEFEVEDQGTTSFNLDSLLDSLMETQQGLGPGNANPGNPIHPNPLEKFFQAQPTAEETDSYADIPEINQPNAEQQQLIEVSTRYNRLKRDRTNIYSSITKMTNNINKVMANRTVKDWNLLLQRANEAKQTLWNITQELNKISTGITKEENVKAFRYQKTIESTIAKITSHIQALVMGLDECIAQTTRDLEPEQPQGAAGLEAQRAAGILPLLTEGGETAKDREMMQTLINLFGNMTRHVPPPIAAPTTPAQPLKDYRGLKPIEIPCFSGDTLEYHYFKKAFEAAHDYRNLDKTTLALLLKSHLKGQASRLAQDELRNKIDDTSYDIIWETLEARYGGSYNETIAITEQFNKLPMLTSFEFKELERTHNSFKLQRNYYERYDESSLKNEKSMLNIQAKSKLSVELGNKYMEWCADRDKLENFNTMLDWLKTKYDFALKSEREYGRASGAKSRDERPSVRFGTQSQEHEYDDEVDGEDQDTDREPEQVLWTQTGPGKFKRFDQKSNFGNRSGGFSKPGGFGNKTQKEPLQLKPTDTCVLCKTTHEMSKCPKFKELNLNEKRLIVRSSVLCFHCLSTKHFVKDCKVQEGKVCGIRDCKQYHHNLLHADRHQINFSNDLLDPLSEREKDTVSELTGEPQHTVFHVAQKGAVSLQTLVCNVSVEGGNLPTVALLDTGSTMTVIDEDFAMKNKLKIIRQREGQEVYTIDRLVKLKGTQYLIELTVSSSDNMTSTRIEAWTVKNLVQDCGIVDWSERKKDFPHLRRIEFPKLPENPRITILFGINTTRLFNSTNTKSNSENPEDPVAMKTFLGWTCIGRSSNPELLKVDPTSQLTRMFLTADAPK